MDAAPQLRRRPLAQLLEALRAQGARTEPPDAERLPLTLEARGLAGGSLRLPGGTSSQFISALLMAAPLGRAPLELAVGGLVSRPYVDMTLAMMAQFGVEAERRGHERFRVAPGAYIGRDYTVEPDASTASYFFAAAAVTGGRVKVLGLRREGGLQGDIRFLDVLEAMGCSVSDEPDGVVVAGPGTRDRPDRRHERHLRHVHDAGGRRALRELAGDHHGHRQRAPQGIRPHRRHGEQPAPPRRQERRPAPTSCACTPARRRGGRIDPHGDHRIAMSFAVLGLRARGVVVEDPGCVSKTCPDFFELWTALEQGTA